MSNIESVRDGISKAIAEADKAPAMDAHRGWSEVHADLMEASDKLTEGLEALMRADGGLPSVQSASQLVSSHAGTASEMIASLAEGSQEERAAVAVASAARFKETAEKRAQLGAAIASLLETIRPAAETIYGNLDDLDGLSDRIATDEEDITTPQAQNQMVQDATAWRDSL